MIAVDTNVVVRLMVEDDERQVGQALRVLEEAGERSEPVLVTDIVLAEVEWVLESAYNVPRRRIVAALQALLADERFTFEDRARAKTALDLYQRRKGDLADYLLGLRGEEAGARTTFTFDGGLRGDSRFTVLKG